MPAFVQRPINYLIHRLVVNHHVLYNLIFLMSGPGIDYFGNKKYYVSFIDDF
jgi:hypothetical protein